MLAIEIEYLAGRAVATDTTERTVVEWPPHPQRLFSALVAAAEETGLGTDADVALTWLERQPPPSLVADSNPSHRTLHGHFVPVNDQIASPKKVKKGDERLDPISLRGTSSRQERFFPCCLPNPAACQFVWPSAKASNEVARALARILDEVTYLGHSSSPIRATLTDRVDHATFEPFDHGDYVFRVPGPGRLQRLRQVHQARLRNELIQAPIGRTQRYRAVKGESLGRGPLELLTAIKIVAGPAVGIELGLQPTALVGQRFRQAILSHCEELDEQLHGHDENGGPTKHPHMAIVPLANIGHRYADGAVKGFAVLLPRAASAEVKTTAILAIHKLVELKLGPMGSLQLLPIAPSNDDLQALHFANRYVRPARVWTTVTPMALDRWPKKKLPIETVIRTSIQRFGLPQPTAIETSKVGICVGTPATTTFACAMHDGTPIKQLAGRPLWHVRLTFSGAVTGPIVLGRARFLGMGLFFREPRT